MILREKTCYFTGHRSILTADRETIVGQMVDYSSICVCCWIRDKGGTAYMVHYAEEKGLKIIIIAQRLARNAEAPETNRQNGGKNVG